MKMKLMKNKKYLQQKFMEGVCTHNATDFKVGKSYVLFTCTFPMLMPFCADFSQPLHFKNYLSVLVSTKQV